MKAWTLHSIGDIQFHEVEVPELKPGEVLVQVHAAGICGSDIPRIYQTGAHHMPLIPGHEFSGEVIAAENSEDKRWIKDRWKGKRVGIFPLIPCMKCEQCKKHRYEMCRSYNYLGSRCNGGFAEYVAVPEWNLIELPEAVSYEEAAMLEPASVAVHAMRRVMPDKSDRIAICGMGTIGMLLLAVLLDADMSDIYVIGNKDFQKAQAVKLGLPKNRFCDSRSEDVSEYLKASGGVDVYFECVGKPETIMQGIECAAPQGRICMVGNPYSGLTWEKDLYWKILRSQLLITGSWNSGFDHLEEDDWHYVVRRLSAGTLPLQKLITHRFRLSKLDKGLEIMRDKSEDYIKIMAAC